MLENILLSAAYYESFSKFATSLNKNDRFTKEEITNIAEKVLDNFLKSAEDSGASETEIKSLGEDLYLLVVAELDKQYFDDNEADDGVQELAEEIFSNLIKDIGLI